MTAMPSPPPQQQPAAQVNAADGSDQVAASGSCGGGGGGGRAPAAGGDGAGGANSCAAAGAAASPAPPLVFLSHAGEQKRGIVSNLHSLLTKTYEVAPVFLDEFSLESGTYNEPAMLGAISGAPVGAPLMLLGRSTGIVLGAQSLRAWARARGHEPGPGWPQALLAVPAPPRLCRGPHNPSCPTTRLGSCRRAEPRLCPQKVAHVGARGRNGTPAARRCCRGGGQRGP
jgi:hypothetical protein